MREKSPGTVGETARNQASMTIIQPKKAMGSFMSPFIVVALVAIIICAGTNILLYGRTVVLRRAVQEETLKFDAVRAANAILKQRWYQTLDAESIVGLVKDRGFVKISSPRYLSS